MTMKTVLLLFIAFLAGSITAGCGPEARNGAAASTSSPTSSQDSPSNSVNSLNQIASEDQVSPDQKQDEPPPRQRSTIRSGGLLDLTFDNLEFDIKPDQDFERSMLTKDIEALDGKRIILRGFMDGSSLFQTRGIEQFVLVRDNGICCFGPGAKIYHNVMVEMADGKSTDFSRRTVEIEGKFEIRPWVNPGDGKTYSVFHMTADRIKL